MYLSFYGLEVEPFRLTPDPDFLFLGATHKEALASLVYGVTHRRGIVSVVGEVGTGKTTLLRTFLQHVNREVVRPIYVHNPNLDFDELMKRIVKGAGTATPSELFTMIERALEREYRVGHNVVLIVDEAQTMPVATLDRLRMLTNIETTKVKLIQVVLAGQPELQDRLKLHELRQLDQRVAVRATTGVLSNRDSYGYIQHRIERGGSKIGTVFTGGALTQIVKHARGNPRMLNILCDNALIAGYGAGEKPISASLCRAVVGDLEGRGRWPLWSRKVA